MGLFDNFLGAASAIGGIGIGVSNFISQEKILTGKTSSADYLES